MEEVNHINQIPDPEKITLDQLKAAIERSDLEEAHAILDTKEALENPNLVKVEFTNKQTRFLDEVCRDAGGFLTRESVITNLIEMAIKPYKAERDTTR